MDRATIAHSLHRAELRVLQDTLRVARQRELMTQLEHDGFAAQAKEAAELLGNFEKSLSLNIADRDHLLKKMSAMRSFE